MRTDDDLEAELGAALTALIPPLQPAPDLAWRVGSRARIAQRRRRNGSMALAAVAALVVGLGVDGLLTGPDPREVNVASSRIPPPVDARRPHLVFGPAHVSQSGSEVALSVANPTDKDVRYGVGGTVDRWNGSRWLPFRYFVPANAGWDGAGRLDPLTGGGLVFQVAVTARAHLNGPVWWVAVRGLTSGFYRFTNDGIPGVLEVSDRSSVYPPTLPGSGPILRVARGVESGEEADLAVSPEVTNGQNAVAAGTTLGRLTGAVTLERQDARGWAPLASLAAGPASGQRLNFIVHLPALQPGFYRLSRASTLAGNIRGVFWVF